MKKTYGTLRARKPERQKPEKRKSEKQAPDPQKPTDRPPAPWFQNRDKSANAMLCIPRPSKGAAFWENQSIKVNGGAVARPGVNNEVSVVIHNLGTLSALNVTVYFYWASPACGLSNLNKIAVVD